jgi:hypothetical protein
MWDYCKHRKRIAPSDPTFKISTYDLWIAISEFWHKQVSKSHYQTIRTILGLSEENCLSQQEVISFFAFTERFMICRTDVHKIWHKHCPDCVVTNGLEEIDFKSTKKFNAYELDAKLITLFLFINESNSK